jgi:hypothetical protein
MSEQNKKHSLELRLQNYKKMHDGTAANKKVSAEFAAARTLTQARKVLWGTKGRKK